MHSALPSRATPTCGMNSSLKSDAIFVSSTSPLCTRTCPVPQLFLPLFLLPWICLEWCRLLQFVVLWSVVYVGGCAREWWTGCERERVRGCGWLYLIFAVVVKFFGEVRGGRGLIARKGIAKGQIIFHDRALIAARYMPCEQTDATRSCSNCLKSIVPLSIIKDIILSTGIYFVFFFQFFLLICLFDFNFLRYIIFYFIVGAEQEHVPQLDAEFPEVPEPIPCPHCKTELYCSTKCQETAWDEVCIFLFIYFYSY